MTTAIVERSIRLDRRSQRHRKGGDHRSTPKVISATPPTNKLEQTALNRKFHRLTSAQRNVRFYTKILLCSVAIRRGYKTLSNLSHHRHWMGNLNIVWGNAFTYHQIYSNVRQLTIPLMVTTDNNYLVPKELLQPFGSYPNVFNITPEMASQFHPVVKFPRRKVLPKNHDAKNLSCAIASNGPSRRHLWPWLWMKRNENERYESSCASFRRLLNETYEYIVQDFTGSKADEYGVIIDGGKKVPHLLPTRQEALDYAKRPNLSKQYDVGRYDEDRGGMYTSSLFLEKPNDRGSREMRRTVHVGIDIGGPVGTKVFSFEDGIVHSAGYNPDVGDYGHVIVIEHTLFSSSLDGNETKVYALYGHLDAKSTIGKYPGLRVTKGQVIGRMGNTAENGGWTGSHVHIQLAVHPPEVSHDMPGTVTVADRNKALLEYIDPRYVLGELY